MRKVHKEADISWVIAHHENKDLTKPKEMFPIDQARLARRLHNEIPGYKMTNLVALPRLAKTLGVGEIYVKNEAERMALSSFKVMGGSFALFKFFQDKLGLSDDEITFEYLMSEEARKKTGICTFASATDGNHGRGIAWAAQLMGHKCMIYVHSETSQARIDAIAAYGATVKVIPGNYDNAVHQCVVDAEKNGWDVISDTSWEGYTKVPTRIMQGYNTMFLEAQNQFCSQGIDFPTHIFIQAGVGALAASIIGFYSALCNGHKTPKFIVVEPEDAACVIESAIYDDGKTHDINGSLSTIMAGLACGETSPIAWEILKEQADVFMSVPDYVAARGMRILATPLKGDPMVISGESGAVTIGALYQLMTFPGNDELKEYLHLDKNSKIMFVNTEGNTDPLQFRRIVWDGSTRVPSAYATGKIKE